MEPTPKRWPYRTCLVLLKSAALCYLGYVLLVYVFLFPIGVRDVWMYSRLRAGWNPKLVGHFPEEFPASASLKKFSHFPGFLQGGGHIQLRLRLPSELIQQLYVEYSSKRTKSFFGGSKFSHVNKEEEGMPTTNFYTGESSRESFPEDYEIMIFDRIWPESERPSGFHWNHGSTHGVAISRQRNEIIYWAERW